MSRKLILTLYYGYKPKPFNYLLVRSARTWSMAYKHTHVGIRQKPLLGNIEDERTAKDVTYALLPSERRLLYEELKKTEEIADEDSCESPTVRQLITAFQCGFWPFIGFGFFDNAIMILAGDLIEYQFGQLLCISTMAAAALGNLVSDVCGMWLAVRVENLCRKVGIHMPHLTRTQLEMRKTRMVIGAGKVIGISIGCLIGMAPLLFT